ncbi:MAG: hypothetical protein ACLPN6_26470 [Streptosporangiaceae bacterium]|jgi:hypothetical protein|nr:hypothetical protein [Actinomycetota bacterium]
MELSAGQRKAVFVLIVIVLAGLGFYLFTPIAHGTGRHPSSARSPSPRQTAATGTPAASAPVTTPAPTAAPTAAPGETGPPDIYQWLPFTQAGLDSAAAMVTRFGVAYGTFSYTQSAAAYVAPLRSMASPQLAGQISAAYVTPGVTALRVSQHQVSTGTASILSLRAFGPGSITFVVAVTERITSTNGTSQVSTDYAVTVTGGDTSWLVSDVELASAGNS